MPSQKVFPFTLKQGERFTNCTPSSTSCTDDIKTTRKDRSNGDLVVEINDFSLPVRAVFYYPDKEICTANDPAKPCDLEATFEGQELEDLINSSNDLIDYQRLIADNKPQVPTVSPDIDKNNPAQPPLKTDPPAGGLDWLLNPLNLLFIPLLILASLFVSQVFKALTAPPQTSRKAAAHRRQIQPGATQAASPATTDEIRRQLSTIQSQIDQLSKKQGNAQVDVRVKIERLTDKIDALEQELTSLKVYKYLSAGLSESKS